MKKTIAIVSVLMAAALTGILSTSPIAFADSADYVIWRKNNHNDGSGESTNNNCALNSIDTTTAVTVACPVTSGPVE